MTVVMADGKFSLHFPSLLLGGASELLFPGEVTHFVTVINRKKRFKISNKNCVSFDEQDSVTWQSTTQKRSFEWLH